MSHDRGCPCGLEKYEYNTCEKPDCDRRDQSLQRMENKHQTFFEKHGRHKHQLAANEKQVGGDHYKTAYEHWDFVENNGLGYLEGCATKYATRWRKKDGLQDLEKAEHYIIKLQELHLSGKRLPRTNVPDLEVRRFCTVNKLSFLEFEIVTRLSTWANNYDLIMAKEALDHLIIEAKQDA